VIAHKATSAARLVWRFSDVFVPLTDQTLDLWFYPRCRLLAVGCSLSAARCRLLAITEPDE